MMSDSIEVVSWADLKAFVSARFLSIQYLDVDGMYIMHAIDGPFHLKCTLNKAQNLEEVADFETNFKPSGNISFSDIDGTPIQRFKAARKGYTYGAVPFEFTTSRLRNNNSSGSDDFFSQDQDGNDRSWITCKIYKNDGTEITTPGLAGINYADATKTVIDFEPTFDYEVIGGVIRTVSSITSDIRLYVIGVPDIAAQYGGSKEMCGGINLNFLAPNNVYSVDGRVTKFLQYSATYHTNKIRIILKYPAGTAYRLSVVVEMYRQ